MSRSALLDLGHLAIRVELLLKVRGLGLVARLSVLLAVRAVLNPMQQVLVVLLVDLGTGVSVASSADMLIPYVISTALYSASERIHWSRTRWFQCDMDGCFDEIQLERYQGGMSAEITWLPRPRPLRTAVGFASLVAREGFNVLDSIADFVATQREIAACDADHARSLHSCGN